MKRKKNSHKCHIIEISTGKTLCGIKLDFPSLGSTKQEFIILKNKGLDFCKVCDKFSFTSK